MKTQVTTSVIPDVYPDTLEECLKILETIRYKSSGFPMLMLYYNFSFNHWSCAFRNPVNVETPDTKADTMLESIYLMFDFLKTLPSNKTVAEVVEDCR